MDTCYILFLLGRSIQISKCVARTDHATSWLVKTRFSVNVEHACPL
jgi:hypothetical protein